MKKLSYLRRLPLGKLIWQEIGQLMQIQRAVQLGGSEVRIREDFEGKTLLHDARRGRQDQPWREIGERENVFTDHTLAHPLNCRGGVVARLST